MSSQTVFKTAGSTSQTIDIALVQKAAATSPGDPITGLAFNTSSLTAYYRKGATGTLTAITLATQTVGGAYSSGGLVEISSTNSPGLYRFDIPDTVIATAGIASVTFTGAANLATHTVFIIVTAIDLYDAVKGGMSAISGGGHSGTAQAGTSTTITLASIANSSTNDVYKGQQVALLSGGTGGGQNGRIITGYVASTRVATVTPAWAITPDSTSVYVLAPAGVDVQTIAATAQTGRDIGASVLLSSGTGTGQIALTSGKVELDSTGNSAVATAVWDEATSSHRSAGSFGAMLQPFSSGTAQAGAATSITLVAGASAVTDFYKNCIIEIVAGTGIGQARFCTAYNGTTKVATVTTWATTPDNTSVYVVQGFDAIPGATAPTASQNADAVWNALIANYTTQGSFGERMQNVRAATAQAGTSSSITLDASASATDNLYRYQVVYITAGTGAGQARQITAYTGSSKVAAVGPNWTVNPDNTSKFVIMPLGIDAATVAAIAQAVWDESRAAHVSAGTFGEHVLADTVQISGNTTAADNAQSAFDTTGFAFTNCTMPQVTTVTGNVNGSVASVTGAVGSVTGAVGSVTGAVGSVTGNVGGNVVGSVASVTATVTASVSDKTGFSLSNAGIDALFTRQLTESYAADGAAPTIAQALMLIQQMLGDFTITGTTLTVRKVDGSTTAASFTLNDTSAPTALTRAA